MRLTGILGAMVLCLGWSADQAAASDWPQWRGVTGVGVSDETDLPGKWSREGENLIWRQDYIGRSTPVVHNGRVFVTGRTGEGSSRREVLSAFSAEDGSPLWETTLTTQLTTVPFNRAGWAGPAVDSETGYVYAQGVAGPLVCFDRDGNLIWERMLYEEIGRYSGYGGRTMTPLVDEDRLIVSIINSSWGKLGKPSHRYYAFDKKTGDVLWISSPGGTPADLNTSGNAATGVVAGKRLYISGNADGNVYAIEARTGRPQWSFQLSKRGVNSSLILVGDTVFVGHSEENLDEATLGRVVAIDATGSGDVTATHELWRQPIKMGFPSPLYANDRLYVMDNSANLMALDPKTGEMKWSHEVGTVGKSAPVYADGKIYLTEVNGNFLILADRGDSVEVLDEDHLTVEGGRYAETYASPAIAYGRIFFTTEEGIYAIGKKDRAFSVSDSKAPAEPAEKQGGSEPTLALVVPGDVTVDRATRPSFEVRLYNDVGQELSRTRSADWSLDGLTGSVSKDGTLSVESDTWFAAGHVVAKVGDLVAQARVRSFSDMPWTEDFDDIEGKARPHWIGAGRYQVTELEGQKVLEKPVAASGLLRSNLLIGPYYANNYTIQAEVMGGQKGRRRTDVGMLNTGYFLDLLGNSQKLEIRSWSAVMRMAVTIPFEWDMQTWYVMKLRVDSADGKAQIKGKVWKKGDPEPDAWTIEAEDSMANRMGAPALQAYSPASVYFDNVVITKN
jgi:outer membrane protein assembly factor BamB